MLRQPEQVDLTSTIARARLEHHMNQLPVESRVHRRLNRVKTAIENVPATQVKDTLRWEHDSVISDKFKQHAASIDARELSQVDSILSDIRRFN